MLWLKTLLFTIIAPGTLTVLLPLLLAPNAGARLAGNSWWWLGGLPMLLGAVIYLWCVKDFITKGRGTPAPYDPPKLLVINGLYHYTRNPMYVGITLLLFGEALLSASAQLLVYAAIVLAGFHLRVVYYEEPRLRSLFGEAFEEYCRQVPRWLLRLQ